jgi:alpha-1,3-fucosyltransferase 10
MQAMENSVEQDYVTEKVYHALEAGCVPIYFGAPNVDEYVPDMEGIIDYAQLRSPAALLTELERLANNQTAYEQKLAWKQMPLEKMSPGGCGTCSEHLWQRMPWLWLFSCRHCVLPAGATQHLWLLG